MNKSVHCKGQTIADIIGIWSISLSTVTAEIARAVLVQEYIDEIHFKMLPESFLLALAQDKPEVLGY